MHWILSGKKPLKTRPPQRPRTLSKPKPIPKIRAKTLSKPKLRSMGPSRKAIRPCVSGNKQCLSRQVKTMKAHTNHLLQKRLNKNFMNNFVKHGFPQPRSQRKP